MKLFELYNVLKDGQKGRNNFLVTVIQGNGTGSRYFLADGEVKAQCSSGDIETERLRELVQPGESGIAEADGRRLFVESLKQPAHLVICGAGHVAQQVILLAGKVGFTVTVLEDRVSFAGEALRAGADQVICDSFENALKQIPGSEDTYFLVVTRGHRYDRVCLEAILKKTYAYVGMMASRGRSALLKKQMEEDGFDRKVLDEINSPNLRIILDPVNLLESYNYEKQDEIFDQAIELLGKDVAVLHVKDFVIQDGRLISVPVGFGQCHWDRIMPYMKKEKPYMHATLEDTKPENAVEALHYIQGIYEKC